MKERHAWCMLHDVSDLVKGEQLHASRSIIVGLILANTKGEDSEETDTRQWSRLNNTATVPAQHASVAKASLIVIARVY
jgi:hypothetical protein